MTLQHSTALESEFRSLFGFSREIPSATAADDSSVAAWRLHRFFGLLSRPSLRRQKKYRVSVPTEALECRQLLTDPMAEMNAKFYDAILMSNAKIDSFFGQGATQITGQLNGALGGAGAKFNLSQPGDVEIEEATLNAISAAFGTTETRTNTGIATMAAGKPTISFSAGFEIGTPYVYPMMMMPGMQFGNHGYAYVNAFNGDFNASSNWVYEVPSSVPGVLQTRLTIQGTMSRTNGIDTFDLVQNLTTTIGDETKTFTVDYDRTGTGTSETETLYFYATHSSGPITTTAMGRSHNGQWDTWSFGGTANFGDLQVSISKSFMYQTTRLFGSIEFLSGNTRASAQIRQVNDVTAAMGELSYESAIDKYLQIGIGKVSGTTTDGRRIDDSYGKLAFSLPVERFFPWSPTHVVVSSAWHNSDTWGGDPVLTSTPPTISQGTLYIMHDALRSDIWGHIDQFWVQFALPY